MLHRRVTYRSATLRIAAQSWPFGAAWEHETLRLLVQARWRPATDVAETTRSIEVTVDLAGVDEDDFEVQLFDNGLVVEGRRHLPSSGEDAVYHAAGIPQGFFRLELPLPAFRLDHDLIVEADRHVLQADQPQPMLLRPPAPLEQVLILPSLVARQARGRWVLGCSFDTPLEAPELPALIECEATAWIQEEPAAVEPGEAPPEPPPLSEEAAA